MTVQFIGGDKVLLLVIPQGVPLTLDDATIKLLELHQTIVDHRVEDFGLDVDVRETHVAGFIAHATEDADREQTVLIQISLDVFVVVHAGDRLHQRLHLRGNLKDVQIERLTHRGLRAHRWATGWNLDVPVIAFGFETHTGDHRSGFLKL